MEVLLSAWWPGGRTTATPARASPRTTAVATSTQAPADRRAHSAVCWLTYVSVQQGCGRAASVSRARSSARQTCACTPEAQGVEWQRRANPARRQGQQAHSRRAAQGCTSQDCPHAVAHLARSAGRRRPAGASARSAGPRAPAARGCGTPGANGWAAGWQLQQGEQGGGGAWNAGHGSLCTAAQTAGNTPQNASTGLHSRCPVHTSAPGPPRQSPRAPAGGGSAPPARPPALGRGWEQSG